MSHERTLFSKLCAALILLQFISVLAVIPVEKSEGILYGDPGEWTLVGRDEYLQIEGGSQGWGFGTSTAAGDIDGDGRDDIAVGIPDWDENDGTGAVLIYFARDLDEIFPLKGTEDADLIIFGEDTGDRFGANLATGDMNNDGRDEILIAAPDADGKDEEKRSSGEVYILAGRLRSEFSSMLHIGSTTLYAHIYGRDGADQIGQRIVLGDLTGDGIDDLVLGTNGAGGYGGTTEFTTDFENNAPGSWEIEVIEGGNLPPKDIFLGIDPVVVRYYSSWNMSGVGPSDNHAMGIGTGMDIADINGDGENDLLFSFTRWVLDEAYSSEISVINGGPGFPHVPRDTTIDVIIPSFLPNMTIQLNDTVLEPPKLEAGDLDGDEYSNLVIGGYDAFDSSGTRFNAGRVWIMNGFDHSNHEVVYDDRFSTTIYGEDSSDGFGSELLCLDIDGDSYDEVLIGAPEADGVRNLYTSCGEGYRYEFDGFFQSELHVQNSDIRYMGMRSGQRAFSSILPLSINRDDQIEFLVSSPGFVGEDLVSEVGMISLFMERQEFESRFFGGEQSSAFGDSVLIEDFNNDGYDDIVVADPNAYWTHEGGVYLFFGSSEGFDPLYQMEEDADVIYQLTYLPSQAGFGNSMSSGDLNDDGYPDLIVGAPDRYDGWDNPGSATIFWGGTRSYMEMENSVEILGDTVEKTGYSVLAGDFNGDGVDDLAISSPASLGYQSLNRFHAGMVSIILGPVTSGGMIYNMVDFRIYGSIPNEAIGMTLAKGDINNDSMDDLIIGAPRSDLGSITDQGLVYIVPGRSQWTGSLDLASDPSIRIFGAWPYDQAGTSMETGDIDGDSMDDLALGCPTGDGYQRTTDKGGNMFLLFGKYLSSFDGSGNISLRNQYNVTIFGEETLERFGSSIAFGDIDDDGVDDLAIGAKGWKDTLSGYTPGGVMILQSTVIRDGSILNSSSLPLLSSKGDGDEAGSSVAIGNLAGDGRNDIIIGSPSHDPYGDGSDPGGVFLWEGKDLNYRDLKVSTAKIQSDLIVEDPEGIRGSIRYLSPGERSYVARISARSLGGFQDIDSIEMNLFPFEGTGSASFEFKPGTRSLTAATTGDFNGEITLDLSNSTWRTDGVEKWYVDIGFDIGWNLPDIDQIVTVVTSGSEYHENYLSEVFRVDRTISVDTESIMIEGFNGTDIDGWLKNDSMIDVSNITLYHEINGEQITGDALDDIKLGIFRPDGIPIGVSKRNGSTIDFDPVVPGDEIFTSEATFTIGPFENDPLPNGSQWSGDHKFSLMVDTIAPPEVSTFNVFPDGLEKGILEADDDRFVEVRWDNVFDIGPSGINGFLLSIKDGEGSLIEERTSVESGDLLSIPEGEIMIGLNAFDKAGNHGPILWRSVEVDLTPPRFWGENPVSDSWLTGEEEFLSIMVSDNGTGIDLDSAYYRIYRSDSSTLSEWMNVIGWDKSGDDIMLVGEVPSEEGFGHYVQWKVSDQTGIEAVSQPFGFNIDITPPTVENEEEDLVLSDGKYTFQAYMEDQLSWLDLSTIEFRISGSGEFQDTDWYNLDLTGYRVSTSPTIEVIPDFTGYGYAQWRVSDRAGNMVESDLVTILLDRTMPEFLEFFPNTSVIQTTDTVEVVALISEPVSGMTPGDVEISVSKISDWVRYGVGGYSPWIPVDDLVEITGTYYATHTVKLDNGPFNRVRFRARDSAGNGWVISTPLSIEVDIPQINLAPTAIFTMRPVSDMVFKGESIILDASLSSDPEGENLTYGWYSDLENYPASGKLGSEVEINVTLTEIGVHNIWLIVSDGTHTVESERVQVRVVDTGGVVDEEDEGEKDLCTRIRDSLLFILIALIIGLIIGAIIVYLFVGSKEDEGPEYQEQELVDAKYESDFVQPFCPYCGEEARISDEYCVKCGALFTEKDKKTMMKGEKPKKKKKKRESLKPKEDEDEIEEPKIEDWNIDDGDMFIERDDEISEEEIGGDFFADEPEEIEEDILDLEDVEEIDDLDEIDEIEMDIDEVDLEDDDEIWEVEE